MTIRKKSSRFRCAQHEPDDERAAEDHRQREQHPHGEAAPQEAELRIGFAEKFAEEAGESVKQREGPEDEAGPPQRAEAYEQREHDEQHEPFEPRLIELARMTRHLSAARLPFDIDEAA